MNNINIVGRLVGEPKQDLSKRGTPVYFSVAVSRKMRLKDGSPKDDVFSCKALGMDGTYVLNCALRGHILAVSGSMHYETGCWTINVSSVMDTTSSHKYSEYQKEYE